MKMTINTLLLSIILMACSTKQNEQSADTQATIEAVATPISKSVLANYITLKDAFVKSDVTVAQKASLTLFESLKSSQLDASMIEAATLISTSDDLAVQRTAFKTITDGLVAALQSEGTEQTVFVQHCPMAFDNTGADWLSLSDEVLNPYFGDMMLRCGKVVQQISLK